MSEEKEIRERFGKYLEEQNKRLAVLESVLRDFFEGKIDTKVLIHRLGGKDDSYKYNHNDGTYECISMEIKKEQAGELDCEDCRRNVERDCITGCIGFEPKEQAEEPEYITDDWGKIWKKAEYLKVRQQKGMKYIKIRREEEQIAEPTFYKCGDCGSYYIIEGTKEDMRKTYQEQAEEPNPEYKIFVCYECGESLKDATNVRKIYMHWECSKYNPEKEAVPTDNVKIMKKEYKEIIRELLGKITKLEKENSKLITKFQKDLDEAKELVLDKEQTIFRDNYKQLYFNLLKSHNDIRKKWEG